MLKAVPDVFPGMVLMEIAEAHRKVHNELEENVSSLKVYLVIFFFTINSSKKKTKTNYELNLQTSIILFGQSYSSVPSASIVVHKLPPQQMYNILMLMSIVKTYRAQQF